MGKSDKGKSEKGMTERRKGIEERRKEKGQGVTVEKDREAEMEKGDWKSTKEGVCEGNAACRPRSQAALAGPFERC